MAIPYNVHVDTAAKFIGDVYASLLEGRPLGAAVTQARRQLADSPLRQVSFQARPLQDWIAPVVYEAAPVTLHYLADQPRWVISLSHAEARQERASLDPAVLPAPDVGFYGRDETLLALDRAFDTAKVVLLHAWAGGGKTMTAVEFARWYAITGGVQGVLFTSLTRYLPLARLLDQIGDRFGPGLAQAGVDWATLDDTYRRDVALQVLAQVKMLWVWDNVESVAGFPVGARSTWTPAEQEEIAAFLHELAQQETGCKVLLTSRRDERAWLGDLPTRIALPPMPMLERLELARAVATREAGEERFLEVEDWRPLLDFTQGNPLTVTVLVRQAIREQRNTREQIDAFVAELRRGAARITDDATQGLSAGLGASLDYAFSEYFADSERAVLALLALFQGLADVDALVAMGDPGLGNEPMKGVAGLKRETAIALLDRAAEVGLLTAYGDGYYAVHPAIPWHLQRLFDRYYGPPGSASALACTRAWTVAISLLGDYYHRQDRAGYAEVIGVLELEEANLLRAQQLARDNGWYDLVIGPMQGLQALYNQTGRGAQWRRLVGELTPDLIDAATRGPLPGYEEQWAILISYEVDIAIKGRDWSAAAELQNAALAWRRQQAADALAMPPESLSAVQRASIRNLAVDLVIQGDIWREVEDPNAANVYLEAIKLLQQIGARREEAAAAFSLGHAYKDITGLRDLDQSEYWYRRSAELTEESDHIGRARSLGQLGSVEFERFLMARDQRADAAELRRHLDNAVAAYQESLELLPDDATNELGAIHAQLGVSYAHAGDTSRALTYYQRAIQYYGRQDNRYGAGQARYSAAIALDRAGLGHDAMLYAQAALRDFESVGPGAARLAGQTRQLIALIQQHETK